MTSQASSSDTVRKIYLILLRRSKAFQWRQNRYEILQHIKNSEEGQWGIQGRAPLIFRPKWGPEGRKKFFCRPPSPPYLRVWMTAPPPPLSEGDLDPRLRGSIYPLLVPWWEIWFCVYVRGLSGSLKLWLVSGWFCIRLHFFIKASFIIDTKGLYCVTKGNISFSSLLTLFCFRSAAFLLWVLLLIAICLSKLCGLPLSIYRFLKSEILP